MNIAFLAHDKKKELMVQFCTAYKSVLIKHNLFATATTGRLIADNTGLPLLGVVLEDPDVPMAAACGMSLERYNKRSTAAGSFSRIARRIQGYPEPIKIR